jgi:hypothetical protein
VNTINIGLSFYILYRYNGGVALAYLFIVICLFFVYIISRLNRVKKNEKVSIRAVHSLSCARHIRSLSPWTLSNLRRLCSQENLILPMLLLCSTFPYVGRHNNNTHCGKYVRSIQLFRTLQ